MPPTLPFGGVPRVGIVIARLVHRGVFKGLRPFIVALNDGKDMCKGVTARLVTPHCSYPPLTHTCPQRTPN